MILKNKGYKNIIKNVNKYGFCKAHALSYAQLVWQLAYNKVHNPKKFWKSTLKNTKSCYKKWVHLYEASKYGVFKNKCNDLSVFCKNRSVKKIISYTILKIRFWDFKKYKFFPGCYYKIEDKFIQFKGVIANIKCKQKYSSLLICINGIYEELFVEGNIYCKSDNYLVYGKGVKKMISIK